MDDPPRTPPYPLVTMTARADWRAWLAANHDRSPGIWLVTYKRGAEQPILAYADIVEEALCFGWIDSKANTVDATRKMQLLTPRKLGSPWSRVNKQRLERLVPAGLMHPAGLAKLAAAQADGSWTLLDEVEDEIVPPDLAAALAATPGAAAGFAAFAPSTRKPLLWWLVTARRPATRAQRIARIVAGAAAGRSPLTGG